MRYLRAICAYCGHNGEPERHRFWDHKDRTADPAVVLVSTSRFRCGRCGEDNPFWIYDVAQKALTMNIVDLATGQPWEIDVTDLIGKGERPHAPPTDPGSSS